MSDTIFVRVEIKFKIYKLSNDDSLRLTTVL